MVHSKLNPYITQLSVNIPYVAGDVAGINLPSDLLAAASENVMLAPHWWHRVALAPTSVPQAGQSFGRPSSRLPPNALLNFSLSRSSFQRVRGESSNRFPCVRVLIARRLVDAFYNTENMRKQVNRNPA
jgi:hypothetical protein